MKWINKFLNTILFFAVTICVGVFGYIYFQKTSAPKNLKVSESVHSSLSPEELVNKYMQESSSELQRQKLESANKIKSTTIPIEISKLKEKEINPSDIPIEQQIAKDTASVSPQTTLTEDFNQKSWQSQVQNIQSAEEKKQYAKEFIENAKKNGYHITLSDDLQVTSVKPIRKPTNQQNDTDTFESEPSN
jgi:glutamine cyclotransferase